MNETDRRNQQLIERIQALEKHAAQLHNALWSYCWRLRLAEHNPLTTTEYMLTLDPADATKAHREMTHLLTKLHAAQKCSEQR